MIRSKGRSRKSAGPLPWRRAERSTGIGSGRPTLTRKPPARFASAENDFRMDTSAFPRSIPLPEGVRYAVIANGSEHAR